MLMQDSPAPLPRPAPLAATGYGSFNCWRLMAAGATRPNQQPKRDPATGRGSIDQRQLRRGIVRWNGQPTGDGDHHWDQRCAGDRRGRPAARSSEDARLEPGHRRCADDCRCRRRPVELRAPSEHRRQRRLRRLRACWLMAAGATRPTTARAAIQQLGAGQSISDSFTASLVRWHRQPDGDGNDHWHQRRAGGSAASPAARSARTHSTPNLSTSGALTMPMSTRVSPLRGPGRHHRQQRPRQFHAGGRRQLDLHGQQQPGGDPAAGRRSVAQR